MQSFDFSDPYVGLGDGTVDVAFIRPPVVVADWLALDTLFIEPRVLVVSSDSPLAQHDSIQCRGSHRSAIRCSSQYRRVA